MLVNEFGEIGIDGSIIQGQSSQARGVFIREVPGGCMCCTAGLPMQVALNQLLTQAQPDRLLIEPTGLGHPEEVLQSLSTEHYRDVLALQKILTLVDARKLSDSRYTEHKTFNQQIAMADTIVGNKLDLYQDSDKAALEAYVKAHGAPGVKIIFSRQGLIDLEALEGLTVALAVSHHHHDHAKKEAKPMARDLPIPECGYLKAVNQGEGFYSIGWRFAVEKVFSHRKLCLLLSKIKGERVKAVFVTDKGLFAYNLTADGLTEQTLNDCTESCIEIIAKEPNEHWQEQLMACVIAPSFS